MIKWFFLWNEWRKAYWMSIECCPELFALLHRLYVFHHQIELGQFEIEDALFKNPVRGLLAKLSKFSAQNASTNSSKTEPIVVQSPQYSNQFDRSDILFCTYSHRDTCLGVGEKIFQRIQDRGSSVSGSYYQNSRHVILAEKKHGGIPVATLAPKGSLRSMLRFIMLVPVVYLLGLRSTVVAKFIVRHPLITLVTLLKITLTTDCVRAMLLQIRPKVVVSPNEQGGADASIIFALARKMGIHTIQYMHAIPAKQFTPFICNEYWCWSDLTKEMLLRHEKDDRVRVIGCLEHENRGACATTSRSNVSEREKRILFLSQVGMDEAWGIGAVSAGIEIFRQGITEYIGQLQLRIRLHPNTNEKQLQQVKTLFKGIPYELSTKTVSLQEDIGWASHIYSISSNAIFAALLAGKPAYLFWNEELNEIHGRCFLPNENIVRSREEFLDTLLGSSDPEAAKNTLIQVLGPKGALDRAVDRIEQVVASC